MSKVTIINVILLVISIGLAVVGQLAMKSGMKKVGEINAKDFSHPLHLFSRVVKSVWAVVGVVLYAISAVFWLVVLSRINLSVAYPMVAAGYVVVVFYSWLVFKEEVRWISWVGLVFIVIGVIMTSQGLKQKKEDNNSKSVKAQTAQVAAITNIENETGNNSPG